MVGEEFVTMSVKAVTAIGRATGAALTFQSDRRYSEAVEYRSRVVKLRRALSELDSLTHKLEVGLAAYLEQGKENAQK